ncbi:NADP-dependent oxidoreductase [Rhodohalobacter barkolensis]|uniref:NADP-dependent oxidoreductase n=1 Tax=Rhodohalobacter barkolensis TaxID=2053187 RepID=A0A2N0VIX5_9BACT|nr:NADP-dependent oxidoreductase [Rhodohalobacter barkolensis]PKD44124.1 NADP-dependent oxidoreductase [Rhodohalobacter barkolensis]
MSKKMKAAYYEEFGELNQIKVGELDKPEPGEGEVLIRIQSAGVNPVDAAVARGMLKDAIPAEFPVVPGWDVAGLIEERGHSARRFAKGDKVYAYARRPVIQHGTFAEYISIPESYVAKSPEKLTMEEAGGVPLTGLTAYQSLFDAGDIKDGENLLILGASGGVGSLAIQLAKWKGANVIAVAGSSNQDYMKELGADYTIDYSKGDVGEAVDQIVPDGVDMIFHCSRGDSLAQSHDRLKKGGRLISITNSDPERRDDVHFQYVFVEPNAVQLAHLSELADSGNLKVPVSKTYELDNTQQALQEIESLHTRGKTVITP